MWICKRRGFLAAAAVVVVGIALVAALPASWAARAPRALGGEAADAATAMAHIQHLATAIGPRPAGAASEAAAAEYIARCLSEYGYIVSVTGFRRSVADGLCVSENVVAVSPSPKPGAKTILIAASIDSPAPDSPGADDNASGVAAMLECARIAVGVNARHNLAFAAFGASSMGRAGSKAIAEAANGAAMDPQDVIMAIILDSVGRPGHVSLIPWGGPRALPPSVMAGLVEATGGGRRRFDATIGLLPEVQMDHAPFLYAGVPAVALTTAQSLPYPARGSLAPHWDRTDSVDPMSVAKAADAATAAARWVSTQTRIQAPVRPYLAFDLFRAVITVPYFAVLAVAVMAVALGLLSLGPARYALYTQLTRIRPEGYSRALTTALAAYAVLAAVLWTSFVPTLIVGAVRGIERPWNAHPIPFAVAGAICGLFFAVVAVSLAGTAVRDGVRLPLLRLSILLQIALVCFVFGATRIGAFFPALGLLFTVAALAAPDGLLRKLLASLAPLPAGWLAIRAAQGVARHAFIDALEVPIVLCLLAAAAVLPYVLALIALAPGAGQGQGIMAKAGGLDLARDVMPGVTLREYNRRGPRGMPILRQRQSPRIALMWALGLLAAILTSGLFLKPSYSPQSPQYIHVVQTGRSIVFESADNIRGVSVAGGHAAEPQTVDAGRSEFELPYSLVAPAVTLSVQASGSRISMSLSSDEPVAWAAFELEGPAGMEVASTERSYVVEKTRDSVKIRVVLAGESGPWAANLELSAPSGAQVSVGATGGFRRNPSEIVLKSAGKRFYQGNRFTSPAERITI